MTSVSTVILVIAALALAGCARSGAEHGDTAQRGATGAETRSTPSEPSVRSGALAVANGELEQTVWTMEGVVYGLPGTPQKLAGVVHSPFTGTLTPAAVLHPANKGVIAYNSFAKGRPVLRVHDLRTGEDSVIDEGTYTFAWRHDGALAYFRALGPRADDPAQHRGHIVVRASLGSHPSRWTGEPGRYAVSAWAGSRLIVHELTAGWPNLVAFDGPKRKRGLAERAALVALSADGARAFVTKQPDPAPTVSVIEIASGRELATFTFSDEVDPLRRQRISYVADSGSWAGDTVIAAASGGLAVFLVGQGEITLKELLGVDPEAFPLGVAEPKSDESGRYVTGVVELMQKPRVAFSQTALMECDRVERRCVLGRSSPSFLPPRPIYNPSRP